MLPDTIILECRSQLQAFTSLVSEIDMPTVDLEAVLERVFDAVADKECEVELRFTAEDLSYRDGMTSDLLGFENGQQARIYDAVLNLGHAINDQLKSIGAYDSGDVFPYFIQGLLDADTVVLAKTDFPSGRTSDDDHPGHGTVRHPAAQTSPRSAWHYVGRL
jgi:hypothetical protein